MIAQYKDIKSIDDYIAAHPKDVQQLLQSIRSTIKKVVPHATETISYGIPTFKLKSNLVHFAAYKKHIGFYPGAAAIEVFKNQLQIYKTSKGTIQFSLNQPIPYELIVQIVSYRVAPQNLKINK